MESSNIHWQAPEYHYRERSIGWYWVSIIVASAFIAFAVWQKNVLFGIFIVIAELLVLALTGREPRTMDFVLSDRGLTVDGKIFYPYTELALYATYAEEHPETEWHEVMLRFRHSMRPVFRLHIPAEHFTSVTEMLASKLPHAVWQPSLLDAIQELIGL